MTFEARVTAGVLGLLAFLLVSYALISSLANHSAPRSNEARREELRPKGDFREQVYAGIAILQVASADEDRCRFAHKFGHLFYWMKEDERRAIENEMVTKLSALLDQDTLHGTHRCLSYVIGGIFRRIGPRATAAVPSLEWALKAAELARSERVDRLECMGFEFNPDGRLDNVLREALVSIDGQQREKGYRLKCPRGDDPPG